MLKNETKHKLKNGIIITLCGLLALACAGTAIAFSKVDSIDLGSSSYQIASIDEEGNVEKSSKSSLVSNFVDAKGLEISIEKNAKAGYVVHYYDEDKEYISSSEQLDVDYALETPETAEFVRVEIVPTDDNYISIFEKSEYASQIKVSVSK